MVTLARAPADEPVALDDPERVARVREAMTLFDAGDTIGASQRAVVAVCGALPKAVEELRRCAPPHQASTATAWVIVGRLAATGKLRWTKDPPPRDDRPQERTVRGFDFTGIDVEGISHDVVLLGELALKRGASAASFYSRTVVLLELGKAQILARHPGPAMATLLGALDDFDATGATRTTLLQWAAKAIAVEDWDDDAQDDEQQGIARPEVAARLKLDRAYMPELYARIIEAELDIGQCEPALAAERAASARFGASAFKPNALAEARLKECRF